MGFKRELTRLRNRIKYEDAKLRSNAHRKKTPMLAGLAVLPINRLPLTLRDDTEYLTYTENMLNDAINTGAISNQSSDCFCECHRGKRSEVPTFHTGNCLQNCGENNDQYKLYLSSKLRTSYK